MNADTGAIESLCQKCGTTVLYDRDCPDCGTPSGAASALADLFKEAIIDEIPDPLAAMRAGLLREHQKRQRQSKPKLPKGR